MTTVMPSSDIRSCDLSASARRGDWDGWLAGFREATAFHTRAWAQVLQEAYGYRPHYLVAQAGVPEFVRLSASETPPAEPPSPSRAAGLLPLMEVDSWLTGRRGIALPFTDECDALADSAEVAEELQAAALERGRARKWKYLELRGGPKPRWASAPSTSFYGHTLDLAPGEQALFGGVESAGRRAIRKAEQSGVTVEIDQSIDSLHHLYELLRLTRRRHGVPPQPFSFFRAIHRHLLANSEIAKNAPCRAQGRVFLAKHQSRVVAGALFLESPDTVLFKFGASDEGYQHLRPNNLVMWRAIKHYAAQGFRRLDFGRTSVGNDGLRKFKLSWGTSERTVNYYRFDFRVGASTEAVDRSSGRHGALFRHLPLSLSSLVGALLYRHVA